MRTLHLSTLLATLLLPGLASANPDEATPDPEVPSTGPVEAGTESTSEPAPEDGESVHPGYHSRVLGNGLKVTVLADEAMPVVATQVWIQVGSAHEGEGETGFAHLFEHMMFGETSSHPKEAYSRHHTSHGGYENAYTSFDNTVYISQIPPAGHDEVLQFEADRLVNLVLSQENLDNEKKIVTEELRLRGENEPVSRLIGPALSALFGEHPYAHDPGGTKEDVYAATLELSTSFYQAYYRPGNAHLVVVGAVDGPATLERVEELFGGLPSDRTVPPQVPRLSTWEFPERLDLSEDIPPVKVAALVFATPAQEDPDYWAMKLVMETLSGGEVDLFSEELVKHRKKALEAMSFSFDLQAGGLTMFASVSLPFRRQARAFELLHETIATLGDGAWITEETLEVARRRLLVAELERSYYSDAMAGVLGQAYAWQGDDTLALGGAALAIEQVTLERAREIWRREVVDARPVEVFVHKGKALEPEEEPEPKPTPEETDAPADSDGEQSSAGPVASDEEPVEEEAPVAEESGVEEVSVEEGAAA
ncbi:MAG: pitrilysin family protein, partial [Myxococcota bacterium]|nr:pitrilysin family protein [Myxococcota bacterium]